ncbi:PTS glucose transporter subunit IIA [Pseudomonas aeruginosa]|nr:PTS glucose transporter subunit IIA [Pseudomonas aeruginosa]
MFSSGTLGEGIAIDPLNDCLHAPCAPGWSATWREPATRSACAPTTVPSCCCTVGLDTVQLQGEGFEALVEEGARVIEASRCCASTWTASPAAAAV